LITTQPSTATLYTDLCKLIRQVTPPAVGLASKLKLFWLATLLSWPLTFQPLNWVTGHPCHGLPSCQFFSLLCPSVLHLRSGTGQTDRQTTGINALCSHPMGVWHNNIVLAHRSRDKRKHSVGDKFSTIRSMIVLAATRNRLHELAPAIRS